MAELVKSRSPMYTPLYQAEFVRQSYSAPKFEFVDIETVLDYLPVPVAEYDISLEMFPSPDGGAIGSLIYDADLIGAATIEHWTVELMQSWEQLAHYRWYDNLNFWPAAQESVHGALDDLVRIELARASSRR